jgi:alginate O-acetyltransferase complex protein AlgI
MLFNSLQFILLFLPIALVVFFVVARRSSEWAAIWLALASLFFYASWDYHYLPLLLGSITVNYVAGFLIGKDRRPVVRRRLLVGAIGANLLLLAYFKYANFFVSNLAMISGVPIDPLGVILPIGISFFTFTQIAFLVDTYQGKVKEYKFGHYLLFVTYFPHLIAGPVLHHKEMMPQFAERQTYVPSTSNFAVGFSIFAIGLAKKVLIADNIAPLANPVFEAGANPALLEAWFGAIAYTLQLYFDFSGYSDMAIGLSRMFGVTLPLNFDSPYKAASIIDFWRRWHMTLSRFLRDYLYIPLGGNRNGALPRYGNLMVTMLLGGLWHGAGWTFVFWGALHGVYLVVNRLWRYVRSAMGLGDYGLIGRFWCHLLTLLSVVVAWVFFRSPDLSTALDVLAGMAGQNGISLPGWMAGKLAWLAATGMDIKFDGIRWIDFGSMGPVILCLAMVLALFFPSTQQMFATWKPCLESVVPARHGKFLIWRPSLPWALAVSMAFVASVLSLNRVSEFLYFQF